jgi:hypothetical protein
VRDSGTTNGDQEQLAYVHSRLFVETAVHSFTKAYPAAGALMPAIGYPQSQPNCSAVCECMLHALLLGSAYL